MVRERSYFDSQLFFCLANKQTIRLVIGDDGEGNGNAQNMNKIKLAKHSLYTSVIICGQNYTN